MDYVNKLEQTELLIIGGAVILGIAFFGGFIGYETIVNFDEVKKVATATEAGLLSAIGEPVISNIIVPAADVAVEPIRVVVDIKKEGLSYAKEAYIERDTPLASQWIQIFGSDLYNNGFGSFRYRALAENAEKLAEIYKMTPNKYFSELTAAQRAGFVWEGDVISPFKIRQQLDRTPFSHNLHGVFGKDATSLKHFIWTEYDEIPIKLNTWNELTASDKNKAINLIKKDRNL